MRSWRSETDAAKYIEHGIVKRSLNRRSRRVRVGIVGYGPVARAHALSWRSLASYYPGEGWTAEIVGVATARPATALAAASELGCSIWTTDYRQLAQESRVDLIDCCTPDDLHAPVCIAALEAGKHVYCEKPMAMSVEEAGRMTDAALRARRVHAMAFPVRAAPGVQRARQAIEDGILGTPLSFRTLYLHSGYVDPKRPWSWRLDRQRTGGGALYDLGVHNADLVRYLLGEIVSVCGDTATYFAERREASGSTEPHHVSVDDVAIGMWKLECGAIGTFEFSRIATGLTEGPILEVHGTDGALRLNWRDPSSVQILRRDVDEGFVDVHIAERWPAPPYTAIQHEVVRGIAEERDASPNFTDGYRAQRVLAAVQHSARSGGWQVVGAGDHGAGHGARREAER